MAGSLVGGDKPAPIDKSKRAVNGQPTGTVMNINGITMWASSNGRLERRPDLTAGVGFPANTSTIVYAGGFLWGGLVRDSSLPALRVGGQTYNIGTVPGRIVRPGIAESPANPDVRIFRIRRDWATADLRQDAATYFGEEPSTVTQDDINAIREQYRKDWNEWPWEKGAPYYNRDGKPGYQPDPNGRVDAGTDEPGLADADQVIWLVANDLDPNATRLLYGSPPIGLEMQITCWAYAGKPALANVILQRCRLIYKGLQTTPYNARIDSLYIAKWVDPDVGDYADDYVGCSPSRNLGFAYNSQQQDSKYSDYGIAPPVVGYDLLEGPAVVRNGSSGHTDLRTVGGIANLPMTTFTYFTIGTRTTDFAFGNYDNTRAWWNLLRGYKPAPLSPPQCMTDALTGQCTSFELPGDPVNFAGWLDGKVDYAGDRRFLMASGPASLALGDTQEVVVALIGALGSNNRTGVTALDSTDAAVQDLYNDDFHTPVPVPVPALRIVELNDTLMLNWEKDTAQTGKIERYNSYGYRFETYKIYQYTSAAGDRASAYTFPPFDIYSSPRFLTVTRDFIRNQPLVNGTEYYYAVTAVMANPDPAYANPRIECPVVVLTATPHAPDPGTVYPYQIGATIGNVSDYHGINDAEVRASYYDPTQANDHVYKIIFHNNNPLDSKAQWDLFDSTSHDTLLTLRHVDDPPKRVVTRGMNVQVSGVPFYLKDVVEVSHATPPQKTDVFNHPDPTGQFMIVAGGESVIDTLKGAATSDDDSELRFTKDSSWSLFAGPTVRSSRWVRVPYSAWWLTVQGNDTTYQQVYTFITDFGNDSVWRAVTYLNQYYKGKQIKVFYPLTILTSRYEWSPGFYVPGVYNDAVPSDSNAAIIRAFIWLNSYQRNRYTSIWKVYIADLDTNGVPAPLGTVVRFERHHRIHDGDVKVFRPRAIVTDSYAAATEAVRRINVFPNPYYGMNNRETTLSGRYVTFSHLPYSAVIRIFNVAGTLVRTVTKADGYQFARWDLNNETGLPVAGGVYLAHLQVADAAGRSLGEKTLKLMVVREEQVFK
jgi:hypothetical protein